MLTKLLNDFIKFMRVPAYNIINFLVDIKLKNM